MVTRPIAESERQLSKSLGCFAGAQRANRVSDAQPGVTGCSKDAVREPLEFPNEHLSPLLPGELDLVGGDPVGRAFVRAE